MRELEKNTALRKIIRIFFNRKGRQASCKVRKEINSTCLGRVP